MRNEYDAWQSLAATPARRRPARPAPAPIAWWRALPVALLACVALILAYWVTSF